MVNSTGHGVASASLARKSCVCVAFVPVFSAFRVYNAFLFPLRSRCTTAVFALPPSKIHTHDSRQSLEEERAER
jgi:hypothetical protein